MSLLQVSRWWIKGAVEGANTTAKSHAFQHWNSFARTATHTFFGILSTPHRLWMRFWHGARSSVAPRTSTPLMCCSSPNFNCDNSTQFIDLMCLSHSLIISVQSDHCTNFFSFFSPFSWLPRYASCNESGMKGPREDKFGGVKKFIDSPVSWIYSECIFNLEWWVSNGSATCPWSETDSLMDAATKIILSYSKKVCSWKVFIPFFQDWNNWSQDNLILCLTIYMWPVHCQVPTWLSRVWGDHI